MRYFTPELYRKMQHSHDTPDFMRRWDEACRRAEQERETARPFLSEDMAYYVDLGWHDARIDGIRADGDTVRFRFDGEAADVELVFRGVRKLEKRIESEEIWWLYDEFRRLEDGSFEWGILVDSGEITIRFARLEAEVKRKPYISRLLEEITPGNACRSLENLAKEHGMDAAEYARLRAELVSTYDRTDILKERITQAICEVSVYDWGKSLTETEKNIVALDEAVILLSQEADRDNGLWPHGSRTTLCPLTDGTLRRLAAIAGKSRLPRLGELVRHLQVHEVGETDAAAGVGRFLRGCGITAMEAYREAEAWLTGYVMAHLGELKREDDARQDCCRGATQQSRRL